MAVSEYKKRQIYQVGQLKPHILILPVDTTFIDYSIDNGECRVKAIRCTNVYKIEGLSASYSSSEALEGRFKFSNTLTINVPETNGNTHFSEIAQILKGNYYTIFETNNGDFFMESVDFPVEITYSYSFNNNSVSANVCALSFNSYSNIPTMSIAKERVPAVTQTIIENDCRYNVGRVKRLRMCNYKNVLVSQNRNGFFNELSVNGNQSFDDIDFDTSSFSFTETYDESVFKQTITFTIPLSEYKYYWHYNLIEFTNNRYVCLLDTECGNTIISGFDFGFTPTYTIASAEANSMDTITITLKHIGDCISASNTEGNVIINEDKLTMLSPVNEYTDANGNVHSTTVCIDETTGVRTLFEEMTSTGGHTGKYYCLEGYENTYSNLNIIGTYNADDNIGYPIKFNSAECALNRGCQLLQIPPAVVNFTHLGESHTYNIKGECDWHLEGIPSWLTIQPNEGTANNTVSVTMTTTASPTEEGQTAIIKIVSSDGTYGTFNVNYGTSSSWISPTEFSITAQAQTVTCNILDFNKYNPVSIVSNTSGLERWYRDGTTIKMDVAENNDYVNQRVITAVAQNKQGKRVTITITQDKLYRRLVPTDGYLCDGNNSYKKMQVYKGYTSDNCNIPTDEYEKGDLILENSPDCGGVNKLYRWYALPNEYICNGYNKHYKEVYQVSTDEGLTWENATPLQTRTGQLIEANSIECGYGITWELVPDEYICEKTTGYIRYQKLQKYYLGQPVDPPEYKKGNSIPNQMFENLDVCENLYLWKLTDQTICAEDNSSSGIDLYKPLYASNVSPVSVADAVAGDKVFYRPTQNDIVISKDDIDGASLIGYVVVPASHHRYGVSVCCGIMMPLDKVPKRRYNYDSSFYWNRNDFQIMNNHNVFYNEAGYSGRLTYPNPYDLTQGDPVYADFWNGFYPNPERDTEAMWQNMSREDSKLADVLYNLTTDGTSKRSWYLPSVYEILYIYAKQKTFGITTDRDYLTSTITTHDLKIYILVNTLVNGELNLSDKFLSPEPGDRIPANNGFIIPFAKLYQI